MRLNRLEIAGFKSFADRSELAFDTGVTAIVGPNGCGKSNVVDAITWVLGEQSAKSLRGEQMQDVIFSGSDARKPTSAAEVRLRLSGVASRVPGNGTVKPEPLSRRRGAGRRGRGRAARRRATPVGGPRRGAADRPRRRAVAAALSLGGERVPDRRRGRAAQGRAGPADGRGPGRQGLRGDRAGQDRADPERAADRSAAADRGGGRRSRSTSRGAAPRS